MWPLTLRRWSHKVRAAGSDLEKCWRAAVPAKRTDWRSVSFLVCDAEMSSLELGDGELLSVGWVCVEGGVVKLQSARHILLRANKTVGQSAAIHLLRDCDLARGLSQGEMLAELLQAASGRFLVFHNASLDMAFLNRASREVFGAPLLLPTIDTLGLEHALLNRQERAIKSGDLRLQACRERYNLPAYPAHNALVDAVATAELLIAHARHRAGRGQLQLSALL